MGSPLPCPHCSSTAGRRSSLSRHSARHVSECSSCGRVLAELQIHTHTLFHLQAHDNPLPLVTPDLQLNPNPNPKNQEDGDDDPFHPTGFITAFPTFSLENSPVLARSSSSFAGHLAELERALLLDSPSPSAPSSSPADGPLVSVDNLRAYLQILEVGSVLGLDRDISDHAFQLFRDCSSSTCLRNRSVEALATAALVQAIREAQEPRTLQEISAASNLPQKEIGKYIKILGEALKLSQPINSNSISVHMPRFCTLLQLNKSAQELAAHIGEVVINKCFCTRRNPISISAAAIYLACQLEDKRKTQAEICKVTGLTEVTLRKVYKELLENWDDLLPPNYTPAVPPEKAFPMTAISTGRSSTPKVDIEIPQPNIHQDKEKVSESKKPALDVMEIDHQVKVREEVEYKISPHDPSHAPLYTCDLNQTAFWQPQFSFGATTSNPGQDQKFDQGMRIDEAKSTQSDRDQVVATDLQPSNSTQRSSNHSNASPWQFSMSGPSNPRSSKQKIVSDSAFGLQGVGNKTGGDAADGFRRND
ncbi:uncharacterized protein M6B38_192675 [Iris pallida]|uniref:Cyclin-like domain-containing protein n=1 Tax=Iris pallida TaxID=29817 RepID=A0AAX6ECY5_IRIPA|nr:uncharacterized protein M6B38_192675 [Iris pallida]